MVRVLYLIGTGYSGSTLAAFLANAHSRIATVGEATGPVRQDRGNYLCSCGSAISRCRFWEAVGKAMARRGVDFGPERWDLAFRLGNRLVRQLAIQGLRHNQLDALRDAAVARAPRWGERLRETGRRNLAFAEAVLEVTGKTVFLDASKDTARARLLARVEGLDLRILHLVRDAPGQVASLRKNKRTPIERGVRYWSRAIRHAQRTQALVAEGRFLRVRYEDLCRHPAQVMAQLARFARLEPEPLPFDFRSAEHHIIGNRMRRSEVGSVVLDESWRERLTWAETDAILRRTNRLRRAMGYA